MVLRIKRFLRNRRNPLCICRSPMAAVRPWYNGLQNRLSNAGKGADICHSPCLRGTGHRTGCLLVVYTLIRYGMFVFGAKAPKK